MPFNFAKVKKEVRDIVHNTFSVPAFYSDSVIEHLEINVRLHRKSAFIGDEYQEFSPGYFSEINRVLVDLSEVEPVRNAEIYIPSFDITVRVENVQKQGEDKALIEVKVWD